MKKMWIIKIFIAKGFRLCYGEKMLRIFTQNYETILEKLPKKLTENFLKFCFNILIVVYWIIIMAGTFLMLN